MSDIFKKIEPEVDILQRHILSLVLEEKYARFSAISFSVALKIAKEIVDQGMKSVDKSYELESKRIDEEGGVL